MTTLLPRVRTLIQTAVSDAASVFHAWPASWTQMPCVAYREEENRQFRRADGAEGIQRWRDLSVFDFGQIHRCDIRRFRHLFLRQLRGHAALFQPLSDHCIINRHEITRISITIWYGPYNKFID